MNSTLSNTTIKCVRDTSVMAVVFPCLYSLLFLVALVLNSLAAWIFFNIPSTSTFMVYLKNVVRDLRFYQTLFYLSLWAEGLGGIMVNNAFLCQQVVADLLMTLTIPVKVLSDAGVGSWRLRAFHCRYSAVLFYMTMYVSILLLGLISVDRYLKIVRPFGKCPLQRVRVGKILSVSVWAVMFCLELPNVILSDQTPQVSEGKLKCMSMKGEAGRLWHEAFNYFCLENLTVLYGIQVVFWGTMALMAVCYTFISKKVYESYRASRSSSKAASRQTKARVFVVVVVFFICFAPYHIARVPYTLTQSRDMSYCSAQNALYIGKQTTLWLSATNVCLDPLIYVFLCRVFRRRLAATLCRKPLPHISMEFTETSTQVPGNRSVYSASTTNTLRL